MQAFIDSHPDIGVQESEFKRLLGYPPTHPLEGRSRELADGARTWFAQHGRPWIYARPAGDLKLAGKEVRIEGIPFASSRLHDQFAAADVRTAVVVAVSAGGECEDYSRTLWKEGKPDEYFFTEMYGSAVVEHLLTIAGGRICAWAEQNSMAVLPHYSPGYSGWEMTDQLGLWQVLGEENRVALPGELRILDTGMLQPKKSMLAVFGISKRVELFRQLKDLVPCERCSLPGCAYRRVPYRQSLLQSEGVETSRPHDPPAPQPSRPNSPFAAVKYSVKNRALQKWSRERLHMRTVDDRSIEARFRYEGTTCSNLGCPLEFDYFVTLGPREEGHRIRDLRCVPAPGDTGHTRMCEYLKDAGSLMRAIADEKPLLGCPLDDVLNWQRPFSPSGCHCDEDRRLHKWGLVLEVIHYALARAQTDGNLNSPAAAIGALNATD